MNNNPMDGLNLGVGNIDVLKGTDIGVLRNKKEHDKSTYTVETKPDGTVVETVKMNTKSTNKGLVDLQTEGVNLGNDAVGLGISKDVSEDVVGFVDSIWGSKQVAANTSQRRLQEAGGQPQPTSQEQTKMEDKLDTFRALRELQQRDDALRRQQQNQQATPDMVSEEQMTRGL